MEVTMKIGIISDTHDHLENIRKAINIIVGGFFKGIYLAGTVFCKSKK
jgi:predicted phosphodiesterase